MLISNQTSMQALTDESGGNSETTIIVVSISVAVSATLLLLVIIVMALRRRGRTDTPRLDLTAASTAAKTRQVEITAARDVSGMKAADGTEGRV